MNLAFDTQLAVGYSSNSQIARVLTESWVLTNSYCPSCGNLPLREFENNRPVADFYCANCREEFELKSKAGKLSGIVSDGAYASMINRIEAQNNPNFFFLTYSRQWTVDNFFIVPKQFFTPEIIIQRAPLSPTARRAGWVGCNIDISKIATAGKVFLVKDAQPVNPETVRETFQKTLFLRAKSNESKGWLLEIMRCLDQIPEASFTLEALYRFEGQLKQKFPNNNFIKDKIRQQLQVLRDKGLVEFSGKGNYKKTGHGNL